MKDTEQYIEDAISETTERKDKKGPVLQQSVEAAESLRKGVSAGISAGISAIDRSVEAAELLISGLDLSEPTITDCQYYRPSIHVAWQTEEGPVSLSWNNHNPSKVTWSWRTDKYNNLTEELFEAGELPNREEIINILKKIHKPPISLKNIRA